MPPGFDFIIMIVLFGAVVYFLMIRPQQRKMREHQATIDALEPGARIMLTSGIFGTIRHIAETQAIVELAPGIEVTIVKQAIARVAREDEEEFEFTDEVIEEAAPETPPEETGVAAEEHVEAAEEIPATDKN